MDFSQFDARQAADGGFWFQVKHPQTGALLDNDGTPCRVNMLGAEGREAQRRIADVKAKHPFNKNETPEQSHKRQVAILACLINEFEGIERNGAKATKNDAEWFLDLQLPGQDKTGLSFFEQCDTASVNHTNYLGKSEGS